MGLLQFASLNVRGINDRNKRLVIFDFFKSSNFAIILLQETKTTFSHENDIRKEWHNQKIVINSTKSENCSGGCMVLFNLQSIIVLDTVLTSDGRCIVVDIEFNGSRYHVVNTYFPNDDNDQKSFIVSLYPLISSKYPTVFGGDFNLTGNANIDRYPPRTSKDLHSVDLEQLVNTFDLQDVCRKIYPLKVFFSFRRGLSKSRIDHFYISKNCIINNYQHQEFALSDHDIISTSIVTQNTFLRGRGFWRNRTKLYELENFPEKFKEFWAENLKRNWKRCTGSWWLETKFQIKRFLINLNNEVDNDQNDEIKNLKILLERKKFLTTLYPDKKTVSENYYKCKKELAKKQIDRIKDKIMHDRVSEMSLGDMPTKAFFEKLKKQKSNQEPTEVYGDNRNIEKDPLKVVHVAKEFFEKKFKPTSYPSDRNLLGKFLQQLPSLDDNDLDRYHLMRPVTFDELLDAIMSFKNGKSPGIDGLSIEFYKKNFEVIKHHLLNFINDSIFGTHIPRKINIGVIKLLYKKGDAKDLENYRPITLMNVDLKIITKIFTLRLKPILSKVLHADQFAQPGKQISDLNCLIRDILEEMENGDHDNFFVKFDFAKAFDSLDQNFLYSCLEKMNFPNAFIAFLKKTL